MLQKTWKALSVAIAVISNCNIALACNDVDFRSNLGWCCHNGWSNIVQYGYNHDANKVIKFMESCQNKQRDGGEIMKRAWACYYEDSSSDKKSIWQAAIDQCKDVN